MQALDDDPEYTRSEIAFIFECQTGTVASHVDGECSHSKEHPQYSREELIDAYRTAHNRADVLVLSANVYEAHRDDDHPSHAAFYSVFGSWPAARKFIHEAIGGGGRGD